MGGRFGRFGIGDIRQSRNVADARILGVELEAEVARRIAIRAGIECDDLLDDCGRRRTSIHAALPGDGDDPCPWSPGFNTRTRA